MNEIQRYLAEEIALDCGQGHIPRGEALRRLSVMGVSAAVALALLAACGGGDDNAAAVDQMVSNSADPAAPATSPAGGSAAPGTAPAPGAMPAPSSANPSNEQGNGTPALAPPAATPAPGAAPGAAPAPEAMMPPASTPNDPAAVSGPGMGLPTEAIIFNGPNGPLQGAFASAPEPRGAVLVIHENRGLNDHTRTVVGRFAAAGYAAIALDLLSEEGGTAALSAVDPAEPTAALGRAPAGRFVADMQACLDELERRVPGAKIGAVGFCFGGGMMWQLIATKDPRLAAAAPFYGQLPTGADFTGGSTAVLAFYGENDARINATRDAAETALTAAGLTHQLVTEPGANHAFFNDTGANYNVAGATDAWARVLAWFGEHLAS